MREEKDLERLWESYRWATPAPEASANFMPQLWARIDAERRGSWVEPLEWLAARLLPVAAVVTLLLGAIVWSPSNGRVLSYVDLLMADLIEQERPALLLTSTEELI